MFFEKKNLHQNRVTRVTQTENIVISMLIEQICVTLVMGHRWDNDTISLREESF